MPVPKFIKKHIKLKKIDEPTQYVNIKCKCVNVLVLVVDYMYVTGQALLGRLFVNVMIVY